jgi:dienelactone hydrolase
MRHPFHAFTASITILAAVAPGCSSGAQQAGTATTSSSSTGGGSGTGSGSGGGSGSGSVASSSASASSGTSSGGNVMPTHLPTATGTCPAMSKLSGTSVAFAGQQATVWSGDPASGAGPLLLYYFATGSSSLEPVVTIGQAQIDKITSLGGAVVAQVATTAMGTTTGNDVWYTGDATIADEIVACAVENQKIDPRRIHVAGYSAGALQTTYMWYARSGYVASVLTYSGGNDTLDETALQDPAHPPAALVTHGAQGKDTSGGVIDFAMASAAWEAEIKSAHGFAIDCNDGGAHTDVALRTKIAPQAVQFFLDHPYGVTPEPYTTLPAGFPTYCAIQ